MSRNSNNILWLVCGAFVVYGGVYYTALQRLRKCTFKIKGCAIAGIYNDGFLLEFHLDVNGSTQPVTIQNSKLDLYANSRYVGTMSIPYQQVIPNNGVEPLIISCYVKWENVRYELQAAVMNALSYQITFRIAGDIKVLGLYLPVPPISVYTFNVKKMLSGLAAPEQDTELMPEYPLKEPK